jgi:hypothetical protein
MQIISSDSDDKENTQVNKQYQHFSVIDSGESFGDPILKSDQLSHRLHGFAHLQFQLE